MDDVAAAFAQCSGATPADPRLDPCIDPCLDSRPDSPADPLARAEAELARVLATLADGQREGRESLSFARLAKRSALPMSTLLRYLGVLADARWVVIETSEPTRQHVRLTRAGLAQHDSLATHAPLATSSPGSEGLAP